jgi:multicomponent Na+:H+ antiporter subunit G
MQLLIGICLIIGLFFNFIGVLGLLRFPDVYTRLHAETKTTTFGSIFLGLAVILYSMVEGLPALAVHAAIAVIVLAFTNATGSHAIARAAAQSGIKPVQAVVDKLEEDA